MVRAAFPLLSLAIAGLGSAEDSLYSKRATKRFIDDEGNYNISFYHINDVHAHLDQFSASGTDCTDPEKGCYGGYARVKTVLEETRPDHPDSLLLNVGDEFQGTLFYTFYGGEKIADTLNQIGFDAMTLGNHEWDGGDDALGDFLKNLTFPIVSANVFSDNKKLNSTIKPYHIFEQHNLAVIGVTTETVPSISSPGKGTKFTDVATAVQNSIDEIRKTTNVTRIAAITHIGYEEDKKLAKATSGLQLIMGGHSHTLLGDMEGAEGPYPTLETNQDGDEVFIVTAYRWGEYLGYIDVTYDAEGKILAYHGAPIHLTNATKQDADLQKQVDAWRVPFEEFASQKIGETKVVLDQSTCQKKECALGDLISDAILEYRLSSTNSSANPPSFALVNAGGIRATIDKGTITRGEVLTSFPFSNAVVEVEFTGTQLLSIMEGIVSGVNQDNGNEVTSFLQVSKGVKIEYNPTADIGKRLVRLTIGDEDEDVDPAAKYTVATIDFVAGGGDNFFGPIDNLVVLDTLDEVLVDYIQKNTPIDFQLDGRITAVNGSGTGTTPTEGTPSPTTTPSSAASVGIVSGVVLLVWTALLAVVVM